MIPQNQRKKPVSAILKKNKWKPNTLYSTNVYLLHIYIILITFVCPLAYHHSNIILKFYTYKSYLIIVLLFICNISCCLNCLKKSHCFVWMKIFIIYFFYNSAIYFVLDYIPIHPYFCSLHLFTTKTYWQKKNIKIIYKKIEFWKKL